MMIFVFLRPVFPIGYAPCPAERVGDRQTSGYDKVPVRVFETPSDPHSVQSSRRFGVSYFSALTQQVHGQFKFNDAFFATVCRRVASQMLALCARPRVALPPWPRKVESAAGRPDLRSSGASEKACSAGDPQGALSSCNRPIRMVRMPQMSTP